MKRHKSPQLTPELREALSKTVPVNGKPVRLFDTMACRYCGGVHAEACPRVKRIKFKSDSKPEEIEFWPWGDWPEDRVIWDSELPIPSEDDE